MSFIEALFNSVAFQVRLCQMITCLGSKWKNKWAMKCCTWWRIGEELVRTRTLFFSLFFEGRISALSLAAWRSFCSCGNVLHENLASPDLTIPKYGLKFCQVFPHEPRLPLLGGWHLWLGASVRVQTCTCCVYSKLLLLFRHQKSHSLVNKLCVCVLSVQMKESWRVVSWCSWMTSRSWLLRRLRALCLHGVWASGWSSWSATSSPSPTAWWRRSSKPGGRVHPVRRCPPSIIRGVMERKALRSKVKWDFVWCDVKKFHCDICALCVSAVVVLWVKEWRVWLKLGPGLPFRSPLHSSVEPGGPVSNTQTWSAPLFYQ